MSSFRRYQQEHHQSNSKLSSLSLTVVFILVLVGFSFFVYLRSFLVLHESILASPVTSFSYETWPLAVVIRKPSSYWRTVENVTSPVPVPEDVIITADESGNFTTQLKLSTGFMEESAPVSDEHKPSTDMYAEETAAQVEQDLQELLNIVAESKRRQWIKQHWTEIRVLQSDETSELFARRIRTFLKPPPADGTRNCSLTFFTTWIASVESYGQRELHCLESIFKHHPHACVVIVSRSLDSPKGGRILQPLVERGYRIMAAAPDLPYLFSGTPAQPWLKALKKGRVDPGEISFKQNLSNILRLVVLYKFGGIYLDSDVLILNSLANLSNVIGAQSEDAHTGEWYRLNNAVLIFDKQHPVIRDFIKEFALTFNGSKWGHNGPYLATRVLMRQRKSALGCTVLRTRAFYPVSWNHIPRLFYRPKGDKERQWKVAKLQRLLNESYAIHLWNKETREIKLQSGSIIHELFESQCVLCNSYSPSTQSSAA